MGRLLNSVLGKEWEKVISANSRFGMLEAGMRARALLEISEGVPTLVLLELAAERNTAKAPDEERSFNRSASVVEMSLVRPRRQSRNG